METFRTLQNEHANRWDSPDYRPSQNPYRLGWFAAQNDPDRPRDKATALVYAQEALKRANNASETATETRLSELGSAARYYTL